ncbi:MAG: hypothetical protein HQL95_06435 [Magnetococcales bacterium]|nr:hypothetical protein [Magnetococcales bacterium]
METPYRDPSLDSWMRDQGDEIREVIIEARLPQRQIQMRLGEKGRMIPDRLASSGTPEERLQRLEELNTFLVWELQLTTTVLKAAGAVAARVSGKDLERILEHPLVKAVRTNRRF